LIIGNTVKLTIIGIQPSFNRSYLRLSYGSVQLITLLIIAWIYYKITLQNDTTRLVYSDPKSPFSTDEPEPIVTTVKDYDLAQAKQLATQTIMGVVIISVMHYNWGYLRRKVVF
jgi:Phosphate transport (Pho88)